MAAARQAAQPGEQLARSGSVVPDEHREPGGGRPEPVAAAEQGAERLAQLLRAVRLGREQRQLPSVDAPRPDLRRGRTRRAVRGGRPRAWPGTRPGESPPPEARWRRSAARAGRRRDGGRAARRAPGRRRSERRSRAGARSPRRRSRPTRPAARRPRPRTRTRARSRSSAPAPGRSRAGAGRSPRASSPRSHRARPGATGVGGRGRPARDRRCRRGARPHRRRGCRRRSLARAGRSRG